MADPVVTATAATTDPRAARKAQRETERTARNAERATKRAAVATPAAAAPLAPAVAAPPVVAPPRAPDFSAQNAYGQVGAIMDRTNPIVGASSAQSGSSDMWGRAPTQPGLTMPTQSGLGVMGIPAPPAPPPGGSMGGSMGGGKGGGMPPGGSMGGGKGGTPGTPATPGTPGSNYTDQLYKTVLNRTPESPEASAYWQQKFGDTLDQNEYNSFIQAARPELEGRFKEGQTATDMYQNLLGRAPETPEAAASWQTRFGSSVDPTEHGQYIDEANKELQGRWGSTTWNPYKAATPGTPATPATGGMGGGKGGPQAPTGTSAPAGSMGGGKGSRPAAPAAPAGGSMGGGKGGPPAPAGGSMGGGKGGPPAPAGGSMGGGKGMAPNSPQQPFGGPYSPTGGRFSTGLGMPFPGAAQNTLAPLGTTPRADGGIEGIRAAQAAAEAARQKASTPAPAPAPAPGTTLTPEQLTWVQQQQLQQQQESPSRFLPYG